MNSFNKGLEMAIKMKPENWSEESSAIECVDADDAWQKSKDYENLTKKQKDALELYPSLNNIYLDPKLSPFQKKLKALPIVKNLRQGIKDRRDGFIKEKEDLVLAEEKIIVYEDMKSWLEQESYKLEKNDCSRLHKLISATREDKIVFINGKTDKEFNEEDYDVIWELCHSFVVQHDWAEAFRNADDYKEGEIILPYPITAFEFRVSGKNIIIIALQDEEKEISDSSFALMAFIQIGEYWVMLEDAVKDEQAFIMLHDEIRAISISLESEVANHTIVRAPSKLNKIREEKGKIPLYDYHVVGLNRNFRTNFDGGGTHRSPRFHFRRGHWRHFANHKTYIKWMLVGSPELGFIDKHYKL